MFDPNQFKRAVKDWMKQHPTATEAELVDFCEEQIPPAQYASSEWLVEHTLSWFRHVVAQRLKARTMYETEDEAA
jgi:hemerythrin